MLISADQALVFDEDNRDHIVVLVDSKLWDFFWRRRAVLRLLMASLCPRLTCTQIPLRA